MNIGKRVIVWLILSHFLFMWSTLAIATQVPQDPLSDLVRSSGAVFFGTAVTVDRNDFDFENRKPRTKLSLEVVKSIRGDERRLTYDFNLPMGEFPDGTINEWDSAPQFLKGETYMVFAKRGDWYITPVTNWWHGVFRRENVGGKDVYVNQEGYVVTRVEELGVQVGMRVSMPDAFMIATRERGETPQLFETNPSLEEPSFESEITEERLRDSAGNCQNCLDADIFEKTIAEAVYKYSANDSNDLVVSENPRPIRPHGHKDPTFVGSDFKPNVVGESAVDSAPRREAPLQDPQSTTGEGK